MNLFIVDIGGTNLRISIVDSSGNILKKERFDTPKDFIKIGKIIEESYKNLRKDYNLREIIGISVAGAVFKDEVWIPNIDKNKFPLKSFISEKLKIPVKIMDDRVSGALGEYWRGKGKNKDILLYFIIGTGVGLGIIVYGKPLYGKNGVSGSLGWIPLGKRNSYSSKIGTLESQISGPSILREYNKLSGKNLEKTEEVFELFEKEDIVAKKVISHVGRILGKTLSSILNIFDPDIIIFSGSIGLKWEIFKSFAYPTMNLSISPIIKKNFEITTSELKESAQILGVAYTLLKK
ncbi:MAG: ROK family protein [Dictyoglomaceae bacterium]|nr:ROK family protein [Dictyoglomaceae bacterium]